MWKRISVVKLAWNYGPSPIDTTRCEQEGEHDHSASCSPISFSGFKAHVYSENQDDIDHIMSVVKPLAEHYGWGYKTADQPTLDAFEYYPHQKGKGVTVYFPRIETWDKEASHLADAVEDSGYRQGETPNIHGDHMSGVVGVRNEFGENHPGRNVGPDEYHQLYTPNRS